MHCSHYSFCGKMQLLFNLSWFESSLENSFCIPQELMYISLINKYMSSGNSFSPETNHHVFKCLETEKRRGRVESSHINSRHKKICSNTGLVKMCSLELCRIYYGLQHNGFCFRYFTVQHNIFQWGRKMLIMDTYIPN